MQVFISKYSNLVLSLIYGCVGLVILLLPWLPLEIMIERFLYEDFFYYVTLARNALAGLPVSLDGVEVTNGFHPLWLLLIMVVNYFIDQQFLIPVILSVGAIIHLCQSWLVYHILTPRTSRAVGHIACIFYLTNYRILVCNLCGLETGLALLCVLASVYLLGSETKTYSWKKIIIIALLLGLGCLARLDLLLFALCALGFLLAREWQVRGALPLKTVAAATIIFTCLLPWFIWSYINTDTFLPQSGEALANWRFKRFSIEQPLKENVAILHIKLNEATYDLRDTANFYGLWPRMRTGSRYLLTALALLPLLLLPLGYFFLNKRNRRFVLFLGCYAFLHYLYYFVESKLTLRYMLCANVVVLLGVCIILNACSKRWRFSRIGITLLTVLIFGNSFSSGYHAWNISQGAGGVGSIHGDLLAAARWLKQKTPADAVIGAWNAGILSHYSSRQVVNLDGVVNQRVIEINKQQKLAPYLLERDITYLVDVDTEIEKFFRLFTKDSSARKQYHLIEHFDRVKVLKRQK